MAANPPSVDDLVSRNRSKYAEGYTKSHSVDEVMRGVVKFPSVIVDEVARETHLQNVGLMTNFITVSCCDPRLIPEEFGLFSREEYVVVRNAGGRAEFAVRDIVILSTMTEITDVVIIHHVDCGMTHLTNAGIRESLKSKGLGDDKVDSTEFGEIKNLEQSVRDDLKFLESSPYIAKSIKLHGYVHDMLDSGRLIRV
ncbi:uncharacterized protein A1O9_02512 [Exophiala aquamarina CBS 119918]|uniref:Carbonic anhydrase n=1 Tax=Exophiala aquamarina CBS 119918 TaxID=1182545 RepID=A0A072PNN2_9EURO|nr:uncharacterized protein A1O9_02512 [Exophiala aquamarina CBS 119918]KEF60948.1 hypothetical protein A1O9_02512 [Exophiala aquamarina CBS 119918]